MRGAFGRTYGKCARVDIGQVLISVRCREDKCEAAVEALRRAKFKFPGRQKILKSMKWGFTNYDRETYVKGRQEKWLVATGSMVEYQDKHGRLGQTRATRYNNGHIVPY